jgi:hypothetical protein
MDSPATASDVSSSTSTRTWYDLSLVRVIALAATFIAFPVYLIPRQLALTNNDIWWHLRTGLWILENHAIPRSGLFSRSATLPWIDASWGFDALTAFFYRHGGVAGLPILLMLLQMAIAIGLFALGLSAARKIWPAMALAAVAQSCLLPLQLRPALCSVALLAIELALLLRTRRSGDARVLCWLPLIFLLWANLDWQFAYGLLVLVLFSVLVGTEKLGRQSGATWIDCSSPGFRFDRLAAVILASFLATFATPYRWHLHALVLHNISSSPADRFFPEMHSMRFRQPQDYLLLLLAMSAFFALGRRRSRDLFLFSLLAISAVISFRFMRDNWFVVVCSVAIIANTVRGEQATSATANFRWQENLTVAALMLLVFIFCTPKLLFTTVSSKSFPAQAADYIRQRRLPQPLFNSRDWGGFLTWYLPEYPVSIDGRTDLYGDELNIGYFKLIQAEVQLESDPSFARAQTILLEADSPMAQALGTLPGFYEVYRDNVAVVLIRAQPTTDDLRR